MTATTICCTFHATGGTPGISCGGDVWVPDTAYERVGWEVLAELQQYPRRRFRVVIEHWRDGEDDDGYYRVMTGETVLPMTYRLRRLASWLVAEYAADNYETCTVRIEPVPDEPTTFTRVQVARLVRRARRAVKPLPMLERCDCGRVNCPHPPGPNHWLAF